MAWDILASLAGGGLTGLVGSGITSFMSYKTQKLKGEQDLAVLNAESQNMIAEVNANIQIQKSETEGNIAEIETKAFGKALELESKDLFKESYMSLLPKNKFGSVVISIISIGMAFIDMLRKSVRPTITYYLMGCSTWITYMAYTIIQAVGMEAITAIYAQELFNSVTMTVIYMTTSCVSFWFGDRRLGKIVDKHFKGA